MCRLLRPGFDGGTFHGARAPTRPQSTPVAPESFALGRPSGRTLLEHSGPLSTTERPGRPFVTRTVGVIENMVSLLVSFPLLG